MALNTRYLFADDKEFCEKEGPQPGYFAVSVNLVRGLNWSVPDGKGGSRVAPIRAYEYFRHFQPVAKAGYSIFIYHITPEQANKVRAELGLPPLSEES